MATKLLLLSLFLISNNATAAILFGTGFNSATGGRLVPSLNLGAGSESFELTFTSTGVSTTAYSHSAYKLSAYSTWKAGDFLFGTVTAGFGAGALYAERDFKDSTNQIETKSDYVLGPAFFARWNFLGPVFLAVDGLYGLIGPSNRYGDIIGLNARDNVSFIIGVRL